MAALEWIVFGLLMVVGFILVFLIKVFSDGFNSDEVKESRKAIKESMKVKEVRDGVIAKVGDGNKYTAKLDGVEIHGVVFADECAGVVEIQVCDKSGRVMVDRKNECVVTARLNGKVEVIKK